MMKNLNRIKSTKYAGIALGLCLASYASAAVDLGTYSGCAANDGEFKETQIYDGGDASQFDGHKDLPLKMAFVANPGGFADVYYIRHAGTVSRYNSAAKTTDILGKVVVDFKDEQGLVGIALRGDFSTNPWLYFMYSSNEAGGKYAFRISRIKLKPDLKSLDLTSEKIMITIPREEETWHTAGAMQFDAYDDLWVAVGDNMKTTTGPGNTADLRGGILRIHPDESATGYTIPAGNFAEKMSAYFTSKGNTTLAAQYADPTVVKPEIYVKGTRNAYTLTLDPVRRWLTWGDVGPDQGKVSEEYNLVKEPAFTGWPFYAGQEDMNGVAPYGTPIPGAGSKTVPTNNDAAAKGVKTLPPVKDPILAKQQHCAMTGPIFRYNGALTNATQFPPQFDRKWLVSDCYSDYGMHLMTLNSAGDSISKDLQIFNGVTNPDNLVDLKQGPDGSLYYVNWGNQRAGGIWRVDYAGTCKDPTLLPETTALKTPNGEIRNANWVKIDARSISVNTNGSHHIELIDVKGRTIWETTGTGPMSHALPKLAAPALYQVRTQSTAGISVSSLSYLGL